MPTTTSFHRTDLLARLARSLIDEAPTLTELGALVDLLEELAGEADEVFYDRAVAERGRA